MDVTARNKQRVFVAMSGGVDSSVCASLLKQAGYDVVGVTMRLSAVEATDTETASKTCCAGEGVSDAQAVAQVLEIPHYVMNFEREFQTYVMDYFVQEYARGRTPNPCLACNEYAKFAFLFRKVRALGGDFLATGHYARIREEGGWFRLLTGLDPSKDQSYVLHTLRQDQLAHLLFPIGELTKEETRRLAAKWGLPVADKPDSQDICFIPSRRYRDFVAERVELEPGRMVDVTGREVGRHGGIALYTIGQRKGLGLGGGDPRYVVGLDAGTRTVTVGTREDLAVGSLVAERVNFISGVRPPEPLRTCARYRYRSPLCDCTVTVEGDRIRVAFDEPQYGVCPGQAIVFYDGETALGGAIIEETCRL